MERLGLLVEPAMLPITIIPKHEGIPPLLHEEGWRGVEEKGSRRGLQTSCAEGDPFAITSSAFPSLEGCVLYSGFATADGNLVYNSSSAIILSISSSTTTTDGSAEAFWVVYEILEDDSFDFHCFSNETSTALPYPVEATWICDVDGDGVVEFPTSSEFSTSCDCSTTTATTTDINTGTTTTTDIGTGTSTTTDIGTGTSTTTDIGSGTTTTSCAEGAPFTITSSAFPLMEGCVLYSGFATADGNLVYNSSSAIILSISSSTTTTDGSAEAFWVVYEILDDDSSDFRCISNETSTALPYPVEATWICDVDGDSVIELPTSSEFSTSCDCSTTTVTTTDIGTETTTTTDIGTDTTTTTDTGTDTTTTTDNGTETSTTTDSDTETTTTTNIGTGTTTTTTDTTIYATCNEGESFTITSTVVPEVVGCYSDTGTLNENEVIYTETGTTDDGQNFVLAWNFGEDSAQDVRWLVGYSSLDTTSRENEIYCISTELAANVHPVDVTSWTCDLSDGGSETSDIFLLSDTDFSVTCGCASGITSSSSTTPGSEQNANVGHLSTTLSTFVAVGVGFTATVVHLVRL